MIRRLLLALALTSAAACSPLSARDLVGLDIIDRDTSQVLPEYGHRGQDWVAGVPGHRYSVRLTNTTGERVLVVLSVDGVNAVTGQTAAASQNGYVLGPWETAEIAGWRKSLDDIAQFLFTDLPDSYAARTGRPDDVGVIGIAVFKERRTQPYYAPSAPRIASGRAREQAANKSSAPAESADRAVAEAVQQQLAEELPEIAVQPAKEALFRIFRDVRFSKDKTPYKKHFGAYLSNGGRKWEGAGFYLHIEPGNCFLSAGIWQPLAPLLKKSGRSWIIIETNGRQLPIGRILKSNSKPWKASYRSRPPKDMSPVILPLIL